MKKRIGANLVETVDAVKAVADEFAKRLPEGSVVSFSQDKSTSIRQLLGDLQNHVMIAVILVFIVILYALSGRASLLIGLAIPSSFLLGILMLAMIGFTINIVVLFSLILAVGMLVDDAIIVTEFAERRMSEGMHKKDAYALAAKRMAGPVIAATMTRIAAFSPLLFWPGIVGDFMKYHADHADRDAVGARCSTRWFSRRRSARSSPRRMHEPEHNATAGTWQSSSRRCAFPRRRCCSPSACWSAFSVAYSQIRRRRRVLPQCRAGLRPALRACARQSFARRNGCGHQGGRGAAFSAGRA